MEYTEENERLKDTTKCANIRADLKMCLLKTDCCKIHRHTPKECMTQYPETIPNECHSLRMLFYDCKRSIIDGRRRFRGPKGY